jgi:hypothetical protein
VGVPKDAVKGKAILRITLTTSDGTARGSTDLPVVLR